MGGCLPSCCLWPMHNWAHSYDYSAVNTETGKGFSIANSTYIMMPNGKPGAGIDTVWGLDKNGSGPKWVQRLDEEFMEPSEGRWMPGMPMDARPTFDGTLIRRAACRVWCGGHLFWAVDTPVGRRHERVAGRAQGRQEGHRAWQTRGQKRVQAGRAGHGLLSPQRRL